MAKTLFIEILNDTELRLYDESRTRHLTDSNFFEALGEHPKQIDIVLLDALHVQSKTFTRHVQDKKILSQVIAADMTDYLLHDSSHYCFAHNSNHVVTWVSWIEKTRLATLATRFASIAPHIKALVSVPLLMLAGLEQLDDAEGFVVIHNTPLTYVLRDGQTTVMRSEQAEAWLNSVASQTQSAIELNRVQALVFRADNLRALPNLWQTSSQTDSETLLPYAKWAALAGIAMLAWGANSYLDYRRASRLNADALLAQQQILKQVFPHARGADPYGRLSADYQRAKQSDSATVLQRLERALSGHSLTLSSLLVDTGNKEIILNGTITATLRQSLQDNGFIISTPNHLSASPSESPTVNPTANLATTGVKLTWSIDNN